MYHTLHMWDNINYDKWNGFVLKNHQALVEGIQVCSNEGSLSLQRGENVFTQACFPFCDMDINRCPPTPRPYAIFTSSVQKWSICVTSAFTSCRILIGPEKNLASDAIGWMSSPNSSVNGKWLYLCCLWNLANECGGFSVDVRHFWRFVFCRFSGFMAKKQDGL
jgi:hypothetical protein